MQREGNDSLGVGALKNLHGCRIGGAGTRALGTALAVASAAQGVGFGAYQGVDERGQQLALHGKVVAMTRSANICRQSISWAVGSASMPCSRDFDGLSENYAMTSIHSATTRRAP
jgi:hypothetical protein